MPSGKTKAMAEIRAMAALLQKTYTMDLPDAVKDKLWTLTVYFNSLKDLGKASTLVDDDVKDFIVRTANRKNVIVAGSQRAISKIADGTNANWISNAAKDELATNGVVVKNLGIGCDAIIIPDSFVPYTYDFAGADDTLYVLPDEQLIKIFYEGDVRAKENSEQENHDQTIDIQFQHKVGVELVTSQLFAKYTIA